MTDSQIQEIIIADSDHRVLSASAEAWALVYNDVFVPFEDFLTEESRGVLLERLKREDGAWFTVSFAREPERSYLMRIAEGFLIPTYGGGKTRSLLLAPVDTVLDAYQEADFLLHSYNTMLSLSEDLFFEYRVRDDSITLYNTERSRYEKGTISFDAFADKLREVTSPEHAQALEVFLQHIRSRTPRFAISIPDNVFNEDHTVTNTIIKGAVAHHSHREDSVIGLLHPQRMRGTGSKELSYDALTGLVAKADITQAAVELIDGRHVEGTAIAIVDVDYFKHVNDNYGHQFGDEVLRQIAGIIDTEIADTGLVGRIGGDEFFIIFYHADEERIRGHLRSIKSTVTATFQGKGPTESQPISVSVGTASYPADAGSYKDLFMVADYCLYLAKEKGRNRYIIYNHSKHLTLDQIRERQDGGGRGFVNGRDNLPLGDVLTQMQFLARYGKRPSPVALVTEFADRFSIPLLLLFVGKKPRLIAAAGRQAGESAALAGALAGTDLMDALRLEAIEKLGMYICNNVDRIPEKDAQVRERLTELGVLSYILCPFVDAEGEDGALFFGSLQGNIFWNEQHYMYYRLFLDVVSLYALAEHLDD